MRTRIISLILLSSGIIYGCVADGTHAKARPIRLDDHVTSYQVVDAQLTSALVYEINTWMEKLSLGTILYDHGPSVEKRDKRISMRFTSVTVREILDGLTAADTNYYWVADVNDSVVNIIPRIKGEGVPDVAAKMEERLPRFKVKKLFLEEAVAALVEQAMLQGVTGLTTLDVSKYQRECEAEGFRWGANKISLSLRNKTVRECMNALVAATPISSWTASPFRGQIRLFTYAHGGLGCNRPKMTRKQSAQYIGMLHELDELWKQKMGSGLSNWEQREMERKYREVKKWEKRFGIKKMSPSSKPTK